jgi:hypothetical protein
MAELRLPYDAEQRCRRFVVLARQRQENRGALCRVTVDGVRTRAEPKIDKASALARCQSEMGDLVQNDIGLGRAV